MPLKSLSPGLQVLYFIGMMLFMSVLGELIFSLSVSAVIDTAQLVDVNWQDPRIIIPRVFFTQVFFFLLPFILFLRLTGDQFEDLVWINRWKIKPAFLTLGLAIGLYLLMFPLNAINAYLAPYLPIDLINKLALEEQVQQTLFYQTNGIQLIFGLIVFGLAPAIFEELVFRGFLINKMLGSGLSKNGAIIMSALLFAISHLNPLNILVTFVAGLALGFIYVRFQNIKYGILLHFLFNGGQIIIGYLVASEYIHLT